MKRFLVIGNPIEHSLSPTLHNYWIKNNGIDAVYEKQKLNDGELKQLIGQLKNKKIDVYKNGFKVASIGDIRYNDYWVYKKLERQGQVEKGTAEQRRELYKVRHGQECRAKGTPGFYACNILW